MDRLITLEYFGAKKRHYHIYLVDKSQVAERPHSHDYYQVCYVSRGQMTHVHEQERVELGRGDVFIVPPGVSHSIDFVGKSAQIYSLSFEEDLFSGGFPQSHAYGFLQKLRGEELRMRLLPNEPQGKTLESLLESLLREQEGDWPRELTAAASLVSALLCVLAQCDHQNNQQEYRRIRENGDLPEQCAAYIDAHYHEPLEQAALLKRFGLSRSAFCAMFSRHTGLSLRQYINRRRIQAAQPMLREDPAVSLETVAEAVGYGEMSTFYRNFLQLVGMAPSTYRGLYRK